MLLNKKLLLTAILLSIFQLSCTAANNDLLPSLNKDAFSGFTFSKNKTLLEGYKYKNHDRKVITFKRCKEALDYNISDIASHDYFRFKLLVVSCKAIRKFKIAKSSTQSFFPKKLDDNFYKILPALATPYLSKTEYMQRENKTIKQAYKSLKVTSKDHTAKIITNEDEIYITVLARGDFNNDKIEDLLVSSEWYAKHGHGKHTDLVVLSKTRKDKKLKIDWRLNTVK